MGDTKKLILTEKSEPLKYIKESGQREDGKHYLGKLAGVGADFLHPTRNGRRYPYELWINVENSDDFKEGMATLTIFGEADHPETRVDTSIKEIAIVLTKFEIRKNEGIVYVEFDILDTPNGRILKELLDYGSQIGVSSRGIGDEVVKDGETIIDPDTYIFYGFDAVVMPAVAKARPAVIESANRSLIESFSREIENASCEAELQSIKRIAESVNLPDLDSIKESVDKKLSNINSGEDISNKLSADLGTLARENEELKAKIARLESKASADNIRMKKMKAQLKESLANSRSMSKMLQESKVRVAKLEDSIIEGTEQLTESSETLRTTKERYMQKLKSLTSSNRSLRSELSDVNSKLESSQRDLSESTERYRTIISDLKKKHNRDLSDARKSESVLSKKVSSLTEQLSKQESSRQLNEQKVQSTERVLRERLKNANKNASIAIDKYLEVKCTQSGIGIQTVKNNLPEKYSTADIDKVVSELSDRKMRLGKVPVAIQPRTVRITESFGSISEEDRQTMAILSGNN